MKKYNGNYLGIVIQNDDPQGRGRVKIFVPHISPTVYKNWNEVPKDKKFKFLGGNINSDLNEIYEDLKMLLPWSMCASPITGEMSSGRFNATENYASISDSSYSGVSGFEATEFETNDNLTSGQQNNDGVGEKEGNIYEKYRFRINDAFDQSIVNNNNNVNLFSYEYAPSVYSNKAKGSFAVPSVGSHVWVFFHNGDPLFPVYFAASYGQGDWLGIYGGNKGYDYPGSFENVSLSASNVNQQDIDYYKNKYVINQKGGTLEFVNSDNRESIKISGYNGSFKQFARETSVELATHNDQKLVQLNQFDTVKGFRNLYTGRDSDYIVKGDYYQKIGNFNLKAFEEWHEIVAGIANVKQLFEIQRAEAITDEKYIKPTSTLQTKVGLPAVCPVCLGSGGNVYVSPNGSSAFYGGRISVRSLRNEISTFSPVSFGFGKPAAPIAYPPIFRCPTCEGTGISPSSQDGTWTPEVRKEFNNFQTLYTDNITKLAEIEEKMGLGGNHIIDVTKNKVETIGLVMNDYGSFRIDKVGKITNDAVEIDSFGVYPRQKESPMLEYVHVDDLPGGTYTLNVANRYNVQVGAGGLSLKSYGRVDLSGTITNVGGQQVNIASENEVNIDGGERLSLEANIVSIKNKQSGQVLVDSSLGVNGNMIVRGGLHVDGELSLNHITAPCEFQETEMTKLFGKLLQGLSFTANISKTLSNDLTGDPAASQVGGECTITVTADSNDDKVRMYDHSHIFRNLPLTLKDSNQQVRDAVQANNTTTLNIANPIVNEKKTTSPT